MSLHTYIYIFILNIHPSKSYNLCHSNLSTSPPLPAKAPDRRLPPNEAREVLRELLAVGVAHGAGVGDVPWENVDIWGFPRLGGTQKWLVYNG